MGDVKVPEDAYWGAQTQRSVQNFKIGEQKMPHEIIRGFAYLKKAAALTNQDCGVLPAEKARAYCQGM
jgi:fumarate hydratase class II